MEKRRALPYHKTPTSDAAWDGPANEARLKVKDEEAYREAFAWVDPQADAETKGAYKFIHHEIGDDGKVGAANTRACSDVIAILNGGRGGANIPDDDRHGVWAHVAQHLRDAGKDVPDLAGANSRVPGIELRTVAVEFRATENASGGRMIVGHGAVFNQEAEIWDGIFEVVRSGAFLKAIAQSDVRALKNHDPNFILGRNKAGTLRLSEDSTGLAYEIDVDPNVSYANDLYSSIQRGDISQSSYAFLPVREQWTQRDDGSELRELLEVELFDVSPVTYPAFVGADSQARSATLAAIERGRRSLIDSAKGDRAGARELERLRMVTELALRK